MSAIFSVQNLQTFLRRKNFRPPSRGGPPGPDRPAPPPPPNRGRSPPPERSPKGREGRSPAAGALTSSLIVLLHDFSKQSYENDLVENSTPRKSVFDFSLSRRCRYIRGRRLTGCCRRL